MSTSIVQRSATWELEGCIQKEKKKTRQQKMKLRASDDRASGKRRIWKIRGSDRARLEHISTARWFPLDEKNLGALSQSDRERNQREVQSKARSNQSDKDVIWSLVGVGWGRGRGGVSSV